MQTLRAPLSLLLATLLIPVGRLHELAGIGRPVGAMSTDAPVLATPTGFAFLIWIVIFALFLACAIYQVSPPQKNNQLWRRIGWPFALLLASLNAWMLTAILHGHGIALMLLMAVSVGAVFTALGRAVTLLASGVPASRFVTYVLIPALGLCAGWLTLASFLNLAGTLQYSFRFSTDTQLAGIVTLVAATLAGATALMALRPNPVAATAYAYALVWGLSCTVIANVTPSLSPLGVGSLSVAFTAWLASAAVVLLLAWQTCRSRA